MSFIDYNNLDLEELKKQWCDNKKPFSYLIHDGFFKKERAAEILDAYPKIDKSHWQGTTYINQKNKFTLTKFGTKHPVLQSVFDELNDEKFLMVMSQITGIKSLLGDEELFGGGLHQSIKGAFLDVHVDFNIHSKTKYHRRMNAIIYLNQDWKEAYNGNLELWDMKSKKMIENIAPAFNRLVVFETNEVSFHGHPKPLNTPDNVSRKSLAVYYYTKDRDIKEVAEDHNTIFFNTEGFSGILKNIRSGIRAGIERIKVKIGI